MQIIPICAIDRPLYMEEKSKKAMTHSASASIFPDEPRSVRVKSLLTLRWVSIVGQLTTIAVVSVLPGFSLDVRPLVPLILTSVILNLVLSFGQPQRRINEQDTIFYLLFDTVQLTAMLYFTGGLQNPFAAMMLVYITIAAAILSKRGVTIVGGATFLCLTFLAFVHDPLPWRNGGLLLDRLYSCGVWTALSLASIFVSVYVSGLVRDARKMALALHATQQALSREQRLSAVGSLAAATAHQLGTPLNSITLIAQDLIEGLDSSHPLRADAELLRQQSLHCRDVLAGLGQKAKATAAQDPGLPRLPLCAFVNMAVADGQGDATNISVQMHTIYDAKDDPVILLRIELLHALRNIVENARAHAKTRVDIELDYGASAIEIIIRDDGVGFAPAILPQLGEPYLQRQGSYDGMGLGIFIAKTLIEQLSGTIAFSNATEGGAEVVLRIPLAQCTAPEWRAAQTSNASWAA